mmetsp:Transcript_85773/g.276838  ORF Transcript_85773/g.276838 Transcript_85773/m.276838 type:complete len:533 (-) Transcript_85773:119-1717(-)
MAAASEQSCSSGSRSSSAHSFGTAQSSMSSAAEQPLDAQPYVALRAPPHQAARSQGASPRSCSTGRAPSQRVLELGGSLRQVASGDEPTPRSCSSRREAASEQTFELGGSPWRQPSTLGDEPTPRRAFELGEQLRAAALGTERLPAQRAFDDPGAPLPATRRRVGRRAPSSARSLSTEPSPRSYRAEPLPAQSVFELGDELSESQQGCSSRSSRSSSASPMSRFTEQPPAGRTSEPSIRSLAKRPVSATSLGTERSVKSRGSCQPPPPPTHSVRALDDRLEVARRGRGSGRPSSVKSFATEASARSCGAGQAPPKLLELEDTGPWPAQKVVELRDQLVVAQQAVTGLSCLCDRLEDRLREGPRRSAARGGIADAHAKLGAEVQDLLKVCLSGAQRPRPRDLSSEEASQPLTATAGADARAADGGGGGDFGGGGRGVAVSSVQGSSWSVAAVAERQASHERAQHSPTGYGALRQQQPAPEPSLESAGRSSSSGAMREPRMFGTQVLFRPYSEVGVPLLPRGSLMALATLKSQE